MRQRNIVLLANGSDGRQYPVPFDLDMSGLVDAGMPACPRGWISETRSTATTWAFAIRNRISRESVQRVRREQPAPCLLPADTPG